jgi:threonyl-tRNA synthetase
MNIEYDNDHRNLAKKLDLYHFEEEAPGMIFWHPRGHQIYRALEDFIRAKMQHLGYQEVRTPQLLPKSMWQRSGHWEKFSEHMFVVPRADGRDMALKPMSCPCHVQIFNDRRRSWRELPLRYAEFGACHRDEPSGAMHGLMRTRAFEQDDAHVLCRPDQIGQEVGRFVKLVKEVYASLGFSRFEIALSLRPEKRAGSDADWDWAEAELMRVSREAGVEPSLLPGEGAFYGPKLEFSLRDSQGRAWQCGTAQLDSVLPGRLNASYINEAGEKEVPLMIHHAVLGSMGRFIGILLEECEGDLPTWLAPDQVAIMPISEQQEDYASGIENALREKGVRTFWMPSGETLGRRIVAAREVKIPVMIIVGERERASGKAALRLNGDQSVFDSGDAIERIVQLSKPPS